MCFKNNKSITITIHLLISHQSKAYICTHLIIVTTVVSSYFRVH